ncbi:uncharacterized protein VK521_016720 [Ammospiza maritima maritima]
MLFLRREGKWDEVSYADMFFVLRNHQEWQKDCGIKSPSDPLVLALEKDNKAKRGQIKRCCSACSIGQRCMRSDKVYRSEEQERDTFEWVKGPPAPPRGEAEEVEAETEDEEEGNFPKKEEDSGGEGTSTRTYPTHGSPVASRTRRQVVLQAPLRQAVGPEGAKLMIKVPFTTLDLEAWERIARNYRVDPILTAKRLRYVIKQHNPDWADIQLLLDAFTETEKQLILKTAGNLAEDYCKATQLDVKEHFPLQDPEWDPNVSAEVKKLTEYQEWIATGVERAIPKTINWSALYSLKQGPSETPSEFLERLRDAMRRHTSLDPESEIGINQLVNSFLGQSAGDIRRKLQKIRGPDGRNLEALLEEAWRVFSNREEGYKQGMKRLVAVVQEERQRKYNQRPPRHRPPRLERNQCAICKRIGHWKGQCPERRRSGQQMAAHVQDN